MDKRNKLKILAIDDIQDNLSVLETVMAGALPGAAVFTATSGAKGIGLALAEDPDVILLDIVMPGMDGFEVCRRLKADGRLKNIPVVFLTGSATDKENRIKALKAGGEGFLHKPFEVEELVALIRAMAKIKAAGAAQELEAEKLRNLVAERTNALKQELAERKLAEAEHGKLMEQLQQAQKMESVGRLAGGVAHDFNNILTAIKCYAEFIRKGLDPQDPKMMDVREILKAAGRAVGLTRQLLAFSRRQIMVLKVTDLNKCVADVTNMLRRLIGEDIALTTKLAPAPCLAMLDTGQIEQVLVNLMVNARDAMPGGGKIELSTELLVPSPVLFLAQPDLPRGPLVCLKVRDTGCGMTAEVMSHIYEPFYTTKEQGKGTGLGLSTVFGIVKQSGGDIGVESESGKGVQFCIYFPYCESGPGAAADKARQGAGELKGSETILLVEDEESLRRLVRRVLSSGGYTVLTASCGMEALKELEQRGHPVDLVVTDVVMPGMSGRELAREVARKGLAGRILYMSGYTDDAIVKHGVLEPGLAFIYKPFTIDGLLAKVRAVLDAPADQSKA
ncbi:MAG: response regulator [Elusimicrobiota bacterium]|nr:response regulator [Elusimicrobiota bacterium]